MRASIALAILCLVCAPPVSSFVISPHCRSPTRLEATKAKAKSKKKAPTSSGGFGTKKDVKAPFNAAASLLRSEKLYDKLEKESFQDTISEGDSTSVFREYVVTVQTPSQSWFPAAQLCLLTHSSSPSVHLPPSLSYLAREVLHCAKSASPSFSPSPPVSYAIEPLSEFMTHVYDVCIRPEQSTQEVMTLKEAREILGLEKEYEENDVKGKYRKMTLKYHPDRFVGEDKDSEEAKEAEIKFDRAAKAYDVLTSRNGHQSFYASLGGKARNEFKTVEVEDVGKERVGMSMDLELGGYRCAVRMLDTEISSFFIARNENFSEK
ncbi:hypothetical protein TrST_g367 [Triparma strigata]|uniref:J domain-containing protein n=1 Tax=Triparma strigata TaxID=1606541 RepID=A0A9W7A004_9STRA|nr:hypothetical protein TrST_g367 [Triparma strigata]